MRTHHTTHDGFIEAREPYPAPPDRAPAPGPRFGAGSASAGSARMDGFRYTSHGRAALATALDGGLMPDEVSQILAGRRIVEAFPVGRGESPAAYAARAVSEMFVAYLQ